MSNQIPRTMRKTAEDSKQKTKTPLRLLFRNMFLFFKNEGNILFKHTNIGIYTPEEELLQVKCLESYKVKEKDTRSKYEYRKMKRNGSIRVIR